MKRKINIIIFAIGIMAFLLPFLEISCGQNTLMVITGKQMLTGFTINRSPVTQDTRTKAPLKRRIKGDKYTRGIFAIVIISFLVAVFLKFPFASYVLIFLSLLGGGLLLVVRSRVLQKISQQGAGLIALKFREGFWLLLVVFISAFLINLFLTGKEHPKD